MAARDHEPEVGMTSDPPSRNTHFPARAAPSTSHRERDACPAASPERACPTLRVTPPMKAK